MRAKACAHAREALALPRRTEPVEDLQLGRRERQLAVLVLAVEGQQHARDLAQVGDGGRAAVEVGAGAPVGAHTPGEHELLGVGAEQLRERIAQALVGSVEDTLDVCLARARPHDPARRAAAQQQIERVGEHRLAGPGLAGEDVQPRSEAQLSTLDQQQVLDAQLLQHASRCSSAGDGSRNGLAGWWRTLAAGLSLGGHSAGRHNSAKGSGNGHRPPVDSVSLKAWLPATPLSRSKEPPPGGVEWLAAPALQAIASRRRSSAPNATAPSSSCLLVVIDNLDEMAQRARRASCASRRWPTSLVRCGASCARFDRVGRPSERELLIVLPGADGPRGEIVARRVLDRLRTIKVEARGARRPLRISVGLAAWSANATPAMLLRPCVAERLRSAH